MPQKMKPGDIVRVMRTPSDLPDDSKRVFDLCVGKCFPITAIEEDGRVELAVGQVVGEADYTHSIYLFSDEVELVERAGSATLRIGTRGSALALVQANMVRDALAARGAVCEIVPLKTTGDRITDRPLADIGGKGLFTKELEEALLAGRIDLAVHSMKDVPVDLPDGLTIAAILPREDARDVFISHKARTLSELPKGARVGTSSVRRQAQVLRARPDVEVVSLRGNVDTRLRKLESGEYDAIVLALAGLKRLGRADRATTVLSLDEWLPALSQGAVGIEVRDDDARTIEAVRPLDDRPTSIALGCERAFQSALDGSCRSPIGGHASFEGGTLRFRGEVIAPDGTGFGDASLEQRLGGNPIREAEALGRETGLDLKPRVIDWLAR